jgi:hypothetical protein
LKIYKAGADGAKSAQTEAELAAVNAFAKTELKAEQVYTFSVVLCDNEIDRDYEKFSTDALGELAELFVGRTGIFDHEWKAGNQTARIYRTSVEQVPGVKNAVGENYAVLKGWAYMLRSDKNAALIEEIDAGIKKETSIGCSVTERVCSICGQEAGAGGCSHVPGREYDGKLCYRELVHCDDAYEFSFVAVPAQRGAGVVKGFCEAATLSELVRKNGNAKMLAEMDRLEAEAVLGREYRDQLRKEVLRLGLLCDAKLYKGLQKSVARMGAEELTSLKAAFEKQLEGKFPPRTQLAGRNAAVKFDGAEYIV